MTTSSIQPTGQSVIAGQPTAGDGDAFSATDPRTGEALTPSYTTVGFDQLDDAVTAAVEALADPIDMAAIAEGLEAAADAFEAAVDVVVATADAETALAETRLRGELARTVGQLRMMATEARTGSRRDVVVDPAGDGPAAPALHRTTVPLGVVAVFAASNFPLAFGVAGTDTAAALGAGCPVVAKAHPAQPATAELCGRLLAEGLRSAGLAEGMISVLHEGGHEVGQALVTHPDVDAVAFTGSLRGGRALFDLAATRPRPIPVYAEMGSLNPLVVSAGAAADVDGMVEGISGSYLLGEGQFCTKPGLIVLPDDDNGRAVLTGLCDALGDRTPGHPLLHGGIVSGFVEGLDRAAAVDGVEVVRAPDADGGCAAAVLSTDAATFVDEPVLRDEVFGPATLVVLAGEEELDEVVDAFEPALTASLHFTPEESSWARSMADRLARKVGRVIANGYPTGVRVSPGQHHGGPYPATTAPLHTSVGLAAIDRFRRPVAFQSFSDDALPTWAQ